MTRTVPAPPVPETDIAALPLQKAGAAQLLDRPIDVHDRIAEHVGKPALVEWEMKAVVGHEADGLQPRVQLAQEMADSLVAEQRGPRGHPHAVKFRIDQCFEPEKSRQVRMVIGDRCQMLGVDELYGAFADGHDVVIQVLQQEGVEVDEISCDMERADDTFGAPDGVNAHSHSLHQKAASLWRWTFGDNLLAVPVKSLRCRE